MSPGCWAYQLSAPQMQVLRLWRLGTCVSPSPPPPTQAAASAQSSSPLTRVLAAVALPEEILSFAQAPGDTELPGTAGREWPMGTLACSPTLGMGCLGTIAEVGGQGCSSGTPCQDPAPPSSEIFPLTTETWIVGPVSVFPGGATILTGLLQTRDGAPGRPHL